eukprot:CAMPEP_0204824510 /NCGR_PEP_ID=MMETSP1346-20131115/2512_1 /ASSEMBLY_ACC=CAM_ASM_000771 /TAXON_ID=215587 /ORGANISM="Aplanochytrium stocchinoi, Strain GSBS06" /LENGTH=267 /DNA_ID=CAMNT_0051951689 /DNA_START=380 /DNA_END=1180 /DNA_ORIENTATION=+
MSLKVLKSIVLSKQLKDITDIVLGNEQRTNSMGVTSNSIDFFHHSPKPFSVKFVKNAIIISKQLPRESELLVNLEKCLNDISECNRAISHIQYLREKELGDQEHNEIVSGICQHIPSESTESAEMYEGLNLLEMINLKYFFQECFPQARTVVSLNPSFPFHRVSKRVTELCLNMLVERRSLDYLMFPSNKILSDDIGKKKLTNTTFTDALWDIASNLMQANASRSTQPVKARPVPDSDTFAAGRNADILSRFNKIYSSLFLQFMRIW